MKSSGGSSEEACPCGNNVFTMTAGNENEENVFTIDSHTGVVQVVRGKQPAPFVIYRLLIIASSKFILKLRYDRVDKVILTRITKQRV